ncbi:hypothetical protein [Lysobacter sp. Root690]|uniref:hypothetical protein n=1 Tax=Lysobacter sp. Root690 TaxID=1736588 RepID=UPI000A488F91|nr:hypothetical protein [Lysobacter sp. Root690]
MTVAAAVREAAPGLRDESAFGRRVRVRDARPAWRMRGVGLSGRGRASGREPARNVVETRRIAPVHEPTES